MMDFASVIYGAGCTIVGAILWATASLFFSRKYYLKSKDDADKAMIRLLHDHTTQYRCFTVLARMLEESGIGHQTTMPPEILPASKSLPLLTLLAHRQ